MQCRPAYAAPNPAFPVRKEEYPASACQPGVLLRTLGSARRRRRVLKKIRMKNGERSSIIAVKDDLTLWSEKAIHHAALCRILRWSTKEYRALTKKVDKTRLHRQPLL